MVHLNSSWVLKFEVEYNSGNRNLIFSACCPLVGRAELLVSKMSDRLGL